jgi:carbamoyltransferase
MEFGPRALGGRSILADPRDPNMQMHLNTAIKYRESFRPFAPAILSEHVSQVVEWPEGPGSPYMLFTAYLRENLRKTQQKYSWPKSGNLNDALSQRRSTIPGVTHVDFSMRFQSVEKGSPLRQLLERFFIQTGCPILANTSFNVRGEPIVESPSDAILGFSRTSMDALAIGKFLVMKDAQDSRVIKQVNSSKVQFVPD